MVPWVQSARIVLPRNVEILRPVLTDIWLHDSSTTNQDKNLRRFLTQYGVLADRYDGWVRPKQA